MTLGAGEISLRTVRNEFVAGNADCSLRSMRRGGAYVRANAANNPSVNMAAAVPTAAPINLRAFRSQARLFQYINPSATNITNGAMQNYFGDDWNVDYPKTFINNYQLLASNTSNWGFRVDGGAGTRTLINNGNILGAGAPSESAGGGHALYINSGGLYLYNNSQIFAGGGGGGHGGAGGAGGGGYYVTPNQEGPIYSSGYSEWQSGTGATNARWQGWTFLFQGAVGITAYAPGDGWTYYRGALQTGTFYSIYRQNPVTTYTGGGSGGGGGVGGRGQGADGANAAGTGGAPGTGGGTNAGAGGTGGSGGMGGGWGAYGNTGNTGGTGAAGNNGGGAGGAAGTAGGPPGYWLYADSQFNFMVNVSGLGLYRTV
jgi:hypothetical protein